MTVQTVPYALQNAAHSAAVFRQSASAPFAGGGILATAELAVTAQPTPNMSVVLGPGRAKVPGTSVSPPSGLAFTTQAMYDVLNDAAVTLTIAAASATNPRIDAVYIGVQDSFYSGSNNQAVAGVATGTPGPTPVPPAVPQNSILLGYVAVGANATSIAAGNISNQATPAVLLSNFPHLTHLVASEGYVDSAARFPTFTTDTTNSTDVAQVIPWSSGGGDGAAQGAQFANPGLYLVTCTIAMAAVLTGRSFIQIGADTDVYMSRGEVGSGADHMSVVHASLRTTTPNQQVQFKVFKVNSNTAVNSTRAVIARIA